jgi:hypothetical protein
VIYEGKAALSKSAVYVIVELLHYDTVNALNTMLVAVELTVYTYGLDIVDAVIEQSVTLRVNVKVAVSDVYARVPVTITE